MKTIAWIAMLSGVALMVVGCNKPETTSPADSSSGTSVVGAEADQPAEDSGAAKPAADATPDQTPADAGASEPASEPTVDTVAPPEPEVDVATPPEPEADTVAPPEPTADAGTGESGGGVAGALGRALLRGAASEAGATDEPTP